MMMLLTTVFYGVTYRDSNLNINPLHVTIPTTSISENNEGNLQFMFYVQHTNGFLFKDQLETAVLVIYYAESLLIKPLYL